MSVVAPGRVLEVFWWQTGGKGLVDKPKPFLQVTSTPADVLIGFVVYIKLPSEPADGVFAPSYLDSRVLVAPLGPDQVKGCSTATSNAVVPLDFLLKYTQMEDRVLDLWCGSGGAAIAAAFSARHSISIGENETEVHKLLIH